MNLLCLFGKHKTDVRHPNIIKRAEYGFLYMGTYGRCLRCGNLVDNSDDEKLPLMMPETPQTKAGQAGAAVY